MGITGVGMEIAMKRNKLRVMVFSICSIALCMSLAACVSGSDMEGSDKEGSASQQLGLGVRDVEVPSSYAIADSSTYTGTDPVEFIKEHCFQCHENVAQDAGSVENASDSNTEWLLTYKADDETEARAVAKYMCLVCNDVSQEQIDALADYYTPDSQN